jgi:hypothetical protein
MEQRKEFFQQELVKLTETNANTAASFSSTDEPRPIVVACMDERNTLTEEGLRLVPSQVLRLATGGGRISAEDFLDIYSAELSSTGAGNTVYLVTHEVIGRPELGCAAFQNDMEAQEKFFCSLKNSLADKLPEARIHVVSYDTTTGALRPIDLDERDSEFNLTVQDSQNIRLRHDDQNHAGYGIYVGEAYRAWHGKRNTYFHISAVAPSLESDLNIALTVIREHSDVDLSDKPIMLQLDAPHGRPADQLLTAKANQSVKKFLAQPLVQQLIESGELQIIRSTTSLENWQGKMVESVLETAE